MKQPSEMDVLKQLARAVGIDAGLLFISGDVVYRLTGETVTGTVCQVGTPFWIDAVTAAEIQLSIDDPRPSIPHEEVMARMDTEIAALARSGIATIEFDPPRVTIETRPVDFSDEDETRDRLNDRL